jgi:photosystem II stability/assembly factor-like uncharacterized protein
MNNTYLIIGLGATLIIFVLAVIGVNTFSGIEVSDNRETRSSRKSEGVYVSSDGGREFAKTLTPADNSLSSFEESIQELQQFGKEGEIIFASTFNKGLFRSQDGGETWGRIFEGPTITSFTFDANDPKIVYVAAMYEGRARVYKTFNGEGPYREMYVEPRSTAQIVSLDFDPSQANTLYMALNNGVVLKTTNGGESWFFVGAIDEPIIDLQLHTTDPSSLYLLTATGVYRSNSQGQDFQKLSPSIPGNIYTGITVTSMDVNPSDGDKLILSGVDILIESQDGGQTWSNIPIITPESRSAISTVTYSASNSNKIQYVSGTVFYSTSDGGKSWRTTQLDILSRRSVSSLMISRANDDIIFIGVR